MLNLTTPAHSAAEHQQLTLDSISAAGECFSDPNACPSVRNADQIEQFAGDEIDHSPTVVGFR